MDIYKLFVSIPILLMFWGGVSSCDKVIYDNFEDCPRGVYVNFYSQTECADAPSYPKEIKRLNVYAFDKDNVLRSIRVITEPELSADQEHFIPLEREGLYTVLAWGNIDDHYTLESLTVGESKKSDLLLHLQRSGKEGIDLKGTTLWFGESPVVQLEKMEYGGEQYTRTKANLREYTNRVTVSVDSLEHPEDFEIKLASSNASYWVDGHVAKGDSIYYPGPTKVASKNTCSAFFTTLKLESGHENTLIVTHKPTGREMFRTDLVGVILSSNYAQNINLRCLNDFDVHLIARRCNGTFTIVEIWVNDWLVHSYDIEF